MVDPNLKPDEIMFLDEYAVRARSEEPPVFVIDQQWKLSALCAGMFLLGVLFATFVLK